MIQIYILCAGKSKRFGEDKRLYNLYFGRLMDIYLSYFSKRKFKTCVFINKNEKKIFKNEYSKYENINFIEIENKTDCSLNTLYNILHFNNKKNFLLMDADIIFDFKILEKIIYYSKKSTSSFLLSSKFSIKTNDMVYIYENKNNIVKDISKKKKNSTYKTKSHFIGFCFIKNFNKKYINNIKNLIFCKKNHWEEDGIIYFNLKNIKTHLMWSEMDTKKDIKRCEYVYQKNNKIYNT